MEWAALPPLDGWIVMKGILWSVFWVTVVVMVSASLAWVFLRLTDRGERPEAGPLELAETRCAREEIRQEEFIDIRRDPGDTLGPDGVGR